MVLWQIVIFVGRVFDGVGAWAAGGHEAVPTTTASPTWRIWRRKVCPAGEFGLVHARAEIVIRRHGFASEDVRWQIVILLGAAVACSTPVSPPGAVAASPARRAGRTTAVAINMRLMDPPDVVCLGFMPAQQGFFGSERDLCNFLTRTLGVFRGKGPAEQGLSTVSLYCDRSVSSSVFRSLRIQLQPPPPSWRRVSLAT